MGMNGGWRGGMHRASAMADPTAQLAAAKAESKITAAQEGAWQAYEGVVRRLAEARQAMRTARQAHMQDPKAAATFDPAARRESALKLRESHQVALSTARACTGTPADSACGFRGQADRGLPVTLFTRKVICVKAADEQRILWRPASSPM